MVDFTTYVILISCNNDVPIWTSKIDVVLYRDDPAYHTHCTYSYFEKKKYNAIKERF